MATWSVTVTLTASSSCHTEVRSRQGREQTYTRPSCTSTVHQGCLIWYWRVFPMFCRNNYDFVVWRWVEVQPIRGQLSRVQTIRWGRKCDRIVTLWEQTKKHTNIHFDLKTQPSPLKGVGRVKLKVIPIVQAVVIVEMQWFIIPSTGQ